MSQAAKAYENHVANSGQPDSHAKAKEIIAGFAGAFIDRIVETKGLDYVDKKKAERHGEYIQSLGLIFPWYLILDALATERAGNSDYVASSY